VKGNNCDRVLPIFGRTIRPNQEQRQDYGRDRSLLRNHHQGSRGLLSRPVILVSRGGFALVILGFKAVRLLKTKERNIRNSLKAVRYMKIDDLLQFGFIWLTHKDFFLYFRPKTRVVISVCPGRSLGAQRRRTVPRLSGQSDEALTADRGRRKDRRRSTATLRFI
jgi:hypothetical protein